MLPLHAQFTSGLAAQKFLFAKAIQVASQHFLDGAATPPASGRESISTLPINSHFRRVPTLCLPVYANPALLVWEVRRAAGERVLSFRLMKRWILPFAAGIATSVMAAQAHHSIAGVYDSTRQVTVEGIVTEFHFVNPHPFVTMEVKNGGGSAQEWRLEMDNRWELVEVGMTRETLKRGDRIIVTGSPAREQAASLYIRKLDRPADGFQYEQVGSSPRIRVRPQ